MIEASLLMLLVFIGLLAIGTPIAVALGLSGILGIATGLDSSTVAMVGTVTYASIAKYPLVAIPLFILTGMIFERSGVAGGWSSSPRLSSARVVAAWRWCRSWCA